VRVVLRARDGASIRAGVLDRGSSDEATVCWLPGGADDPPGLRLALGEPSRLRPAERPRIDLLLAMPRPLQFGRLLPMVASLGVGTVYVTAAAKTEKSFFSSHLLREDQAAQQQLRAALVEGLAQAGDTAVPRVVVDRRLRSLLRDRLPQYGRRLVAHPRREGRDARTVGEALSGLASSQAAIDAGEGQDGAGSGPRVLLAVGPEGGWDEPAELELLREHGFEEVTLGSRTLRTDVAVVSLLSVAHASLG